MHYIAEDLEQFDAWIAVGLVLLEVYLAKWAEFELRYGS